MNAPIFLFTGRFTLDATIPANNTATIYMPARNAALVTEGEVEAARAPGGRLLRAESGAAVYEVGSGASGSAPR